MSTNESQVNTVVESSSTQTPVILRDNKNYTVLLSDLQRLVDPINQLLKPEKQLNKVNSINDLTQALAKENLRLKDKTIELNPILDEINSITVDFNDEPEEEKDKYLGYNSIIVKTKPLENKIIPMLTLQMLTQTDDGYVIEKSSDDFCGMARVEIQDIALASNLEYTVTPADLADYTDDVYKLNFKFAGNRSNENIPFENFSDDVKELYTDSQGNSTVFGAKDLTINIPLVEYHEFTVDSKTLGKTYTPADVPPSLDGTGSSSGKIGIKQFKVKATLKSTLSAATLVNYARQGGGQVFTGGNCNAESTDDTQGLGLGYPAIEVPPITIASSCSSPLKFSNYFLNSYHYHLDDYSSNFDCGVADINTVYGIKQAVLSRGYLVDCIDDSAMQTSTNLIDIYKNTLNVDFERSGRDYYSTNAQTGFSWEASNTTLSTYKKQTDDYTPLLVDKIELPFPKTVSLEFNYSAFLREIDSSSKVTNDKLSSYLTPLIPTSTNAGALLNNISIILPKVHSCLSDSLYIAPYKETIYEIDSEFPYGQIMYSNWGYTNTYQSSQYSNPIENYTIKFPKLDATYYCSICVTDDISTNTDIITFGTQLSVAPAFSNVTKQKCVGTEIISSYDVDNPLQRAIAHLIFDNNVNINNIKVFYGDLSTTNSFSWVQLGTTIQDNAPAFIITNSTSKTISIILHSFSSDDSSSYKYTNCYYITADEINLPRSIVEKEV